MANHQVGPKVYYYTTQCKGKQTPNHSVWDTGIHNLAYSGLKNPIVNVCNCYPLTQLCTWRNHNKLKCKSLSASYVREYEHLMCCRMHCCNLNGLAGHGPTYSHMLDPWPARLGPTRTCRQEFLTGWQYQ